MRSEPRGQHVIARRRHNDHWMTQKLFLIKMQNNILEFQQKSRDPFKNRQNFSLKEILHWEQGRLRTVEPYLIQELYESRWWWVSAGPAVREAHKVLHGWIQVQIDATTTTTASDIHLGQGLLLLLAAEADLCQGLPVPNVHLRQRLLLPGLPSSVEEGDLRQLRLLLRGTDGHDHHHHEQQPAMPACFVGFHPARTELSEYGGVVGFTACRVTNAWMPQLGCPIYTHGKNSAKMRVLEALSCVQHQLVARNQLPMTLIDDDDTDECHRHPWKLAKNVEENFSI